MGSPTGLVLECRPSRRAATTCASTSLPLADDLFPRMHRLEEYLSALEEERRKIDAFRRELPICMQLLHDAIESYKEKLAVCKPSTQRWPHMQSSSSFNDTDSNLQSPNDRIMVEEYIPSRKHASFSLNCNGGGELPHKMICKPDWMTAGECLSFQAEANSHSRERCQTDLTAERAGFQRIQEQAFSTSSKPFFHSKNKSGGAFTPFSRDKQVIHPTPRPGSLNPTDFAITRKDQDNGSIPLSEATMSLPNIGEVKPIENVQKELAVKVTTEGLNGSNDSPSVRKARRCWSPELHRRFVNALQQLGGSQVATPKQIRELMQVEGLTNDEVKSHLQKYRLHTRRPSPSQTGPPPQTPQVVVLGGIWVPPEYTVHAAVQQAPTLYNSPQPPHQCQTASSQELCSELGSLSQLHLPPSSLCDQKVQKAAPAHSQSSLQCPLQLTGHSALAFHQPVDTGRDESVGDDIGSDTSSCKGCPQGFRHHGVAEMEDDRSQGDSINGFQLHCTSEDEDSRGSDTSLKMV